MATEREEIDERIDRHKAKIAEELVKRGVKTDVAVKAVAAQVRFGLSSGNNLSRNNLLVNLAGQTHDAYGQEARFAQIIEHTLPPEAFTAFDEPSDDDKAWAGFEERLAATSRQYSREELREQAKMAELDRILNPVAPSELTEEQYRLRQEVRSVF